MIVDPSFMSPRDWADIVGSEIERSKRAIIGRMERVEDWQTWARLIVDVPAIAADNPPRPEDYEEFIDWARAFNNAVRY